MNTLAVLDLGASSFHLLVARPDASGHYYAVHTELLPVRLGSGTLQNKIIDPGAYARGLAAVDTLIARARTVSGDADLDLVAVATSALREARNGRAFALHLSRLHDMPVSILGCDEEARLIYEGVRSGLPDESCRLAVVDLGGGSVQIAFGNRPEAEMTRTLPLGVLRIREAFVPEDGHVSERTMNAITTHVRTIAEEAVRDVRTQVPEVVVFTSGTALAVASLAQELASTVGGTPRLTPTRLSRESLQRLTIILSKLKPAALTSLGVDGSRIDTISAGATAMLALVDMLGFPSVLVSHRALRDGVALHELRRFEAAVQARVARG
jgi:exopolyphosphatase/guanosine-5'-triphosphate,3'-diphosphate pyrophosphatase